MPMEMPSRLLMIYLSFSLKSKMQFERLALTCAQISYHDKGTQSISVDDLIK